MLCFIKQVNNIKLKDFMKAFALGDNAKNSVKDEFKKFNNHIMIVPKHVNNELARIMKNLEEATKKV